jgi:hypothetical protein
MDNVFNRVRGMSCYVLCKVDSHGQKVYLGKGWVYVRDMHHAKPFSRDEAQRVADGSSENWEVCFETI